MRSQFDGLHTILASSGAAVPLVDAPAVEEPAASAASPETANPFPDLPGLADLDRGLYKGGARDALQQQRTNSRAPWPEPPKAAEAERRVSGWAAAAVMGVGLVLGGSAAMALFHDDVSHILSSLR